MKFKDFLRRVIGGRTEGERLAIFRKFKRHDIKTGMGSNSRYPQIIPEGEIENVISSEIQEYYKTGISQHLYEKFPYMLWFWRISAFCRQRRAAAKSSWGEIQRKERAEKAEKRLEKKKPLARKSKRKR
jgi:hypothetical protein